MLKLDNFLKKEKNFFNLIFSLFFLGLFFSLGILFIPKTSFLNQPIRTEESNRDAAARNDEEVSCHILEYDAVYRDLWTYVFKNTFADLRDNGITHIQVVTNFSSTPFTHKLFNVAAFDYHGVFKYRKWSDVPNQEKCAWFNSYPNQPQENPWLSSDFFALRGLTFFNIVIKELGEGIIPWLKVRKATRILLGMVDISYFLTLSKKEVYQTLVTEKFTDQEARSFLYRLGSLLVNGGVGKEIKTALDAKKSFAFKYQGTNYHYDWLAKLHNDPTAMLATNYNWKKFNTPVWHFLKSQFGQNLQNINFYYQLRPQFWALNHYQINQIADQKNPTKKIKIDALIRESKLADNYYQLKLEAQKQLIPLRNQAAVLRTIANFAIYLEGLLKPAKEQLFWKILRPYLLKFQQYKITSFRDLNLTTLFFSLGEENFTNLTSPNQKIIAMLVEKFYPPTNDLVLKIKNLVDLHRYDGYQEINQLNEELNRLVIAKTNSQSCLATTDLRYKKWWEEIFSPLVPKLIKHQITKLYYGVKTAAFHGSEWKQGDWLTTDGLFFNVSAHNYYGANQYASYQQLPDQIKCQLPHFLFQPKRIKTVKSLKIYSDALLPRLANYQKYPFRDNQPWHYVSQFDISHLLAKKEAEIFALVKDEFPGDLKWQIAFIYLGVLKITPKERADYLQETDDYFSNHHFWEEMKPLWKKLTSDQFLTIWKGVDILSLKATTETDFYYHLSPLNKSKLQTLINYLAPSLLLEKLQFLTNHLLELDQLWVKLVALKNSLEKYQITKLEEVDFTSLRNNLSFPTPSQLPSLAKKQLVNLMEIPNFLQKLEQLIAKNHLAAKKKTLSPLVIILLSVLLPLVVIGLLTSGFFWRKKRVKKQK